MKITATASPSAACAGHRTAPRPRWPVRSVAARRQTGGGATAQPADRAARAARQG